MKQKLSWLGVILFPAVVLGGIAAGRRDTGIRNLEWPAQMQYSPAYQSQGKNPVLPEGLSEPAPVAGTIPRGYQLFHYGAGDDESRRAGRELTNPFEATDKNLARGQQVYSNYCAVCHGATGGGDGPIIPKYPNPPSYRTEQSKARSDGEFFHVITMGRTNMPSHAAQVSAEDRWKVILYIRRLQAD